MCVSGCESEREIFCVWMVVSVCVVCCVRVSESVDK